MEEGDMHMDDAVIKQELAKCERRKSDMIVRHARELDQIDAEISVYRRLLGMASGNGMDFAKWLEGFMAESRIGFRELSELLGISEGAIRRWMTGSMPSKRLVGEIGRKLCDLSNNRISYDDMMEMLNCGQE